MNGNVHGLNNHIPFLMIWNFQNGKQSKQLLYPHPIDWNILVLSQKFGVYHMCIWFLSLIPFLVPGLVLGVMTFLFFWWKIYYYYSLPHRIIDDEKKQLWIKEVLYTIIQKEDLGIKIPTDLFTNLSTPIFEENDLPQCFIKKG